MKLLQFGALLTCGALLLASSCDRKPPVKPTPDHGVVLDFHAMFNGQEIEYAKIQYAKPDGELMSVTNWGMILSHLSLMKEDSSLVQLGDGYLYIGFTDLKTNYTFADAEAGKYIGIKFQLGPDQMINHSDPTQWPPKHPLNANNTGLHWGWAGGYIFQALDGQWKDSAGGPAKTYSFHTATDDMIQSFFMPMNFTLESAARKTARIEFWADEYFKDPNVLHLKDGANSHTQGSTEISLMNKIMENAKTGVYRIIEVK